jgi:transcriptional regulator with XRE-family HTH domain
MFSPVRILRIAHGLTQTDLARLSEVSTSLVSSVEIGARELDGSLAERLAEGLGVWVEALYGGHALRAALQVLEDESPDGRPGFVERQAVWGRHDEE